MTEKQRQREQAACQGDQRGRHLNQEIELIFHLGRQGGRPEAGDAAPMAADRGTWIHQPPIAA